MKTDASPYYLQLGRRQDAIREANGLLATLQGPGRNRRIQTCQRQWEQWGKKMCSETGQQIE